MALVLKDRVKETSSTSGTGTLTLAGAVSGFQAFSAVGDGNTTYYAVSDPATGDWEVGLGTYTASGTTLARTTVLSSSNADALVNFAAGSKDVFVTYPSEKGVWLDATGTANATLFGAITATSAALTTGTVSTTPAADTDIANKLYVDNLVASGIHFHAPVRLEHVGNLPGTYNNGSSGVGATLTNNTTQVVLTADGVEVENGDRILFYDQTDATENGVYVVTDKGSISTNWVLTRSTDADTYGLTSPNTLGEGSTFFVQQGDTAAGETYTCNTVGTITFGTTDINFAQISSAQIYSAGTGLTLAGTQFSITNTAVTAATYGSASVVPVFAVNAQGQLTSVTDTTIAINGSQVSGAITGQAGSVANALTLGTYLTGGSFNGSAPITATVDATSANTASKVVARDASGNFAAGTITAALSGNATTATTATNVAGGAANQIVYNTTSGTSAFAAAPSASGQVLGWNGSAFAWTTTIATATTANALNTANTYTVAGLTLNNNLADGASVVFSSFGFSNWEIDNTSGALRFFQPGTTYGSWTTSGLTVTGSVTATSGVINANTSGNALRITQTGTGNALLVEDSTNPDSTPFVVDTNGRLIVGHTTSLAGSGGLTGQIQQQGTTNNTTGVTLFNWATSATGTTQLQFNKSKSGTIGTYGAVSSGDYLGSINFSGDDGTAFTRAAEIRVDVDGTPGTNDMPGRLVFSTTADGASSPTERLRISSTGQTTVSGNAIISTTDNTNAALRITQLGTGSALLVEDSTNPDSTPFVIDANGRVLSGLTAPIPTLFGNTPGVQVNAQFGVQAMSISRFSANQFGADVDFVKSRNATTGSQTVLVSGDQITNLNFAGSDGVQFINAAVISAVIDGTPGTNDMPGRLVFSTTADGASSPTERLRIASTGAIGLSGANYGTSGQVLTSAGSGASPAWATPSGPVVSGGGAVIENTTTVTGVSTLTTGSNGFSVGPITVASGASFTVPSGQRWLVL